MSTILLLKSDFDTCVDLWIEMVKDAINNKILPEDTKSDDVEEIEVIVTGARKY